MYLDDVLIDGISGGQKNSTTGISFPIIYLDMPKKSIRLVVRFTADYICNGETSISTTLGSSVYLPCSDSINENT